MDAIGVRVPAIGVGRALRVVVIAALAAMLLLLAPKVGGGAFPRVPAASPTAGPSICAVHHHAAPCS